MSHAAVVAGRDRWLGNQWLIAVQSCSSSSSSKRRSILLSLFDYFPEEIVIEILLRLPHQTLFILKCVSKRCRSIVSDPKFILNYIKSSSSSPSQLGALLFPHIMYNAALTNKALRSFSIRHGNVSLYFIDTWNTRSLSILASSNGLILSQRTPTPLNGLHALRVTNLLTKQTACLPVLYHTLPQYKWRWTIGFATRVTEINGSYKASYKAVLILPPKPTVWDPLRENLNCYSSIHIFSSDTGSWNCVCELISVPSVVMCRTFLGPDFCYKGIIHWLKKRARIIVTYDPYENPGRFGKIRLPNNNNNKAEILASLCLTKLGDEDEFPKCFEIERSCEDVISLAVWRLVDYDNEEWLLERRCRISLLCGSDAILKHQRLWLCTQVFAVTGNEGDLRYLFGRDLGAAIIDLASGKVEDIFQYNWDCRSFPLVPYLMCPWSSPYYYQNNTT